MKPSHLAFSALNLLAGGASLHMKQMLQTKLIMKTIVLTVSTIMAAVSAFGQGKVGFANDSLHLVYYDPNFLPPLGGQGVSTSLMPPLGVNLLADLYFGTSSGSLTLLSTTTFGTTVGRFSSVNVILPVPGGTQLFFQVQVRDSAFASADAAWAGLSYGGKSVVFTTVPGTSIAYNSIVNPTSPAMSTWPVGTFDMSTQTGLPGARGAIMVTIIPEPSQAMLSVLGIIGLIAMRGLFRFRTQE